MRFSYLTIGLLGAGLIVTTTAAEAATPVNCGDVLNAPGEYYLAGDLLCNSPALQITANDVTLNLRGHLLKELAGGSAGILVGFCSDEFPTVLSNISITNGVVEGFDWGIRACSTTDLRIDHVELINSITGLALTSVSNGDISASVFTAQDGAVMLRESFDNRFHGNRLGAAEGDPGCQWGYIFIRSSYNIVTGNDISGCSGDAGVTFRGEGGEGSIGNIVRGNRITGTASYGVIASEGSTGNIIQANRVTGFGEDLKDLSGLCDNNTWKANQFGSATPTCLK